MKKVRCHICGKIFEAEDDATEVECPNGHKIKLLVFKYGGSVRW